MTTTTTTKTHARTPTITGNIVCRCGHTGKNVRYPSIELALKASATRLERHITSSHMPDENELSGCFLNITCDGTTSMVTATEDQAEALKALEARFALHGHVLAPEAEEEPSPRERSRLADEAAREAHVRDASEWAQREASYGDDAVKYMVPEGLPQYVATDGEYDEVLEDVAACENVLIVGPTGSGKTVLLQNIAKELGRPLVTVNCQEGATSEHLLGFREVEVEDGASVTKFYPGLFTIAAEMGAILYLDEFNTLPDGLRSAAYALMDHRRELTLAEDKGRIVRAAPGFTVVASINEGYGYTGTSRLSDAVRQRFEGHYEVHYLDKAREASLLVKRSGVDRQVAGQMVEVAHRLRQEVARGNAETPVSTRMLLAWARKVSRGRSPRRAAEATLVGCIPTTEMAEREAFRDVVAALFVS